MAYNNKKYYLCFADFSRQSNIGFPVSILANWLLSEMARAFFIPGSSQILSVPVPDDGLNSNFHNFQYLGKASVSNDQPVSTNDLQTETETEFFLPLTHQGCAGKKGL